MSAKAKGSDRERKWRKMMEAVGFMVVKPGGSLGVADLVCMRPAGEHTRVLFDQVKGNAGSPWMHFRSVERGDLVRAAARVNAEPRMIHWPPRGNPRVYRPHEWPSS